MILRLEELEFLLDTVQSFQDCKLERLARLQGDLRGKKRKRIRERQDEKQILRCVCVRVCLRVCMCVRARTCSRTEIVRIVPVMYLCRHMCTYMHHISLSVCACKHVCECVCVCENLCV